MYKEDIISVYRKEQTDSICLRINLTELLKVTKVTGAKQLPIITTAIPGKKIAGKKPVVPKGKIEVKRLHIDANADKDDKDDSDKCCLSFSGGVAPTIENYPSNTLYTDIGPVPGIVANSTANERFNYYPGDPTKNMICKLYIDDQYSVELIASIANINKKTVIAILKKKNLFMNNERFLRTRKRRTIASNMISDDIIRNEYFTNGLSCELIAYKYNQSTSRIYERLKEIKKAIK